MLIIPICRLITGMMGVVAATVGFNSISIWRIELCPTSIRSLVVGITTPFTRLGAGWFTTLREQIFNP